MDITGQCVPLGETETHVELAEAELHVEKLRLKKPSPIFLSANCADSDSHKVGAHLGVFGGKTARTHRRAEHDLNRHDYPMWIFDLESFAFLAVNDAAVRRYGYSRPEFLSMTILDIRPVEDVVPLLRSELRDRRHTVSREHWRHRIKDGTVIQVEITSEEITFNGRPAEIVMAKEISNHPIGVSEPVPRSEELEVSKSRA